MIQLRHTTNMRLLFILLHLLSLVYSAPVVTYMEAFEKLPRVSSSIFNFTLATNPKTVILYGTEWCKNTQRFITEYYDVHKQLRDTSFPLKFFFMDCGTHVVDYDFCQEKGIDGYPTIMYYENGQFVEEVFETMFGDFLRGRGLQVEESNARGL